MTKMTHATRDFLKESVICLIVSVPGSIGVASLVLWAMSGISKGTLPSNALFYAWVGGIAGFMLYAMLTFHVWSWLEARKKETNQQKSLNSR